MRTVTKPNAKSQKLTQTARKFLLSSAVIAAFSFYAYHERLTGSDPLAAAPVSSNSAPGNAGDSSQRVSRLSARPTDPPPPTAVPTDPPPAAANTGAAFRDGTYTGVQANAYYGIVTVKAVIQGGKLTDVQFVDYPHDRRTSQWINSQAMPWLTQEAVQAQSAQVDIISGATLTSQAFIQSLQAALNNAHA